MNGSSTLLQLPIKTRWGTYAKLVSSISANEACLKSAVWDASLPVDDVLRNLRSCYARMNSSGQPSIVQKKFSSHCRLHHSHRGQRNGFERRLQDDQKAFVDAKERVQRRSGAVVPQLDDPLPRHPAVDDERLSIVICSVFSSQGSFRNMTTINWKAGGFIAVPERITQERELGRIGEDVHEELRSLSTNVVRRNNMQGS
uniref:Uncharacterized protein n=1 Tax=Ditylenchus dipsaci TaxID=166011 RepID=A0A915EBY2_9BILA